VNERKVVGVGDAATSPLRVVACGNQDGPLSCLVTFGQPLATPVLLCVSTLEKAGMDYGYLEGVGEFPSVRS
jgi:hypothetical protein